MSNKAISIYFAVFTVLYFIYTVFVAGHGIHFTNAFITIAAGLLSVYYYLKIKKKVKGEKNG
ncbi:MAG: hypothetical protein ACC618_00765 [Patescibacteria group bacterium]